MTHELEKQIWIDKGFEQMGWHDCRIYKIFVSKDLELDIDYIFRWNEPELEGMPFTFWVAPATLVFKAIKNLTIEPDITFADAIEIQDIERKQINDEILWTINTHQGGFQFVVTNMNNLFGNNLPFNSVRQFLFLNAMDFHLKGQQIKKITTEIEKIFCNNAKKI